MGSVVGILRIDKEFVASDPAIMTESKLHISGHLQKASISYGVGRRQLVVGCQEASAILGGGNYSVESLISMLDKFDLQLSVVPKAK